MHVYFKSITLENVRCFGKKQTIEFTDKDGKPSMWNLILGDNGTGKTTVLKSLVLVANSHPRENRWWSSLTLLSFPRLINKEAIFISQLGNTNKTIFSVKNSLKTDNGEYSLGFNISQEYGEPPTSSDLSLGAYGAARHISLSGITEYQQFSAISLFDENTPLLNAEEWLVKAEYIALKDKSQTNLFERVKILLLRLFDGEISDIKIETNGGSSKKISVLFQTHYGWVPLHQLSLGYKTLLAWMVDFARGLFEKYPDSPNPLAEPAVCLVDEIDLHLHPRFQRKMIQFLSNLFPKTQFIVTAHSPLVVQAAADIDANVILLRRYKDEVRVDNDPDIIKSWRIDQVLSSDLFGLDTPFSPKSNEKMERRRKLLRKEARTEKEEAELAEIESEFDIIPPSETALGQKMIEHLKKLNAPNR